MIHLWSTLPAFRRHAAAAASARESGRRERSADRSLFSHAPNSATTTRGDACGTVNADVVGTSSSPGRASEGGRTSFALAHMNYARLIAPMDDPRMVEFARAMGPINEIARSTPGFVWSLDDDVDDDEDECGARRQRDAVECLRDDPLLFPQLSLWRDVDSIRHFAYKSGHAMYYRRRKEWFDPHHEGGAPYSVCWWHPLTFENDSRVVRPPTLLEAFDRRDRLRANGPAADAFDFATHADFPMPSS